jgi:hypothetical protein
MVCSVVPASLWLVLGDYVFSNTEIHSTTTAPIVRNVLQFLFERVGCNEQASPAPADNLSTSPKHVISQFPFNTTAHLTSSHYTNAHHCMFRGLYMILGSRIGAHWQLCHFLQCNLDGSMQHHVDQVKQLVRLFTCTRHCGLVHHVVVRASLSLVDTLSIRP